MIPAGVCRAAVGSRWAAETHDLGNLAAVLSAENVISAVDATGDGETAICAAMPRLAGAAADVRCHAILHYAGGVHLSGPNDPDEASPTIGEPRAPNGASANRLCLRLEPPAPSRAVAAGPLRKTASLRNSTAVSCALYEFCGVKVVQPD
jgi:hypothetical protein